MRVLLAFGARPNFMKIAPIYRAMSAHGGFKPLLVHTGQHFDHQMSDVFLKALLLPAPDFHLGVGPGSQTRQIAEVMKGLEPVIVDHDPDLVIVVGDVNSTLAAALAASAQGVPIAHVEAGLRSEDWRMPEERNRVLVDRLSRYLFTPSKDADANLEAEGIHSDRIFRVGNVMVDSLDWALSEMDPRPVLRSFGVEPASYGLVTLHRPTNVDDAGVLQGLVTALGQIGLRVPLLFPVHPRTRLTLSDGMVAALHGSLRLLPPIGYLEFVSLLRFAAVVLTDSGGIQEEATVLGVPCLTLRENTERPITVEYGGNRIVGTDPEAIVAAATEALSNGGGGGRRPPLWDGRTSERIVEVLAGA